MQYGTAYGEIFNANAWGGATFKIFGLKWGLFLGRPYSGNSGRFLDVPSFSFPTSSLATQAAYGTVPSPVTGILGLPGSFFGVNLTSILTPANHADLLVGGRLGDVALGLKLTYADNSQRDSAEPATAPSSPATDGKAEVDRYTGDHHVSLGAVIPLQGALTSLELSVDVGMLYFRNVYREDRADGAYAEQALRSDGSFSLGALARPILQVGKSRLIVPLFFNMISVPTRVTREFDTVPGGALESSHDIPLYKDSAMDYGVLAALHTRPVEGLTVIYSLGGIASYRKFEPVIASEKDAWVSSSVRVPAAVSAEYALLKWLSVRFGVSKIVAVLGGVSESQELYSGTTLLSSIDTSAKAPRNPAAELAVTCGLGIRAGKKVDIDLAVNSFQGTGFSWDSLIAAASLKFHY
jgi:hypothetical protein